LVAAKLFLPESVAQDGNGGSAGNIFGAREFTAVLRGHAQHAKKAGRYSLLLDHRGLPVAGEIGRAGAA
jgi:hypothetical protein